MLQGNYSGLSVLEKKEDQWQFRNKIDGFDIPSRFFEFMNDDQIIVNHEYKGILTLDIDRDFKKVLKDTNPKLKLTVSNKLSDDPEAQMEVDLDFQDIKDFHPDEIVKKVEPLKQLLDARDRLKQLKLAVLKDASLKKALEGVLKDGSGSIDDLLSKLGPSKEKEKKGV